MWFSFICSNRNWFPLSIAYFQCGLVENLAFSCQICAISCERVYHAAQWQPHLTQSPTHCWGVVRLLCLPLSKLFQREDVSGKQHWSVKGGLICVNDVWYVFPSRYLYLYVYIWWSYRLVGDVLLATGFLSYSGPFNQSFRTLLTERWQKEMLENKIPFTKNLNLTSMMTDVSTVSTRSFTVNNARADFVWL